MALKYILTNPKDFGFNYRTKDLYPTIPTQEITLDSSVANFTLYSQQLGINYKVLKYFNPWLRQSYLKNASAKIFSIKVPHEEYRQKLMLETPNFQMDTISSSDSLKTK